MQKPELLAPAGTLDHLKTALAYGADAVYASQPRYSLRVRNNSFKDVTALTYEQGSSFPGIQQVIGTITDSLCLLHRLPRLRSLRTAIGV